MWVKSDEYRVFVLNESRQPITELDLFDSLSLVFKFNDIGNWAISGAYEDLSLITWGTWLRFERNGELLMVGKPNKFDRRYSATEDSFEISGFDSMQILKNHIALPDPDEDVMISPTYTYTSAYDVRTGKQETIMKEYVSYNASTAALSLRQEPITIEADAGKGEDMTGYARFDNLLELLQELAIPVLPGGEELGFRFGGTSGFEFQVYQPRDLSQTAIFSIDLGTVLSYNYGTEAPTVNYMIAGGTGDDENRIFYSYGDTDSMTRYGLIEGFYDASHVETATDLYPAIIQELFSGADKTSIKVEPAPLNNFKVKDDYWVGDIVTCIFDGVEIQEKIRILELKINSNGEEEVIPTIGRDTSFYYALTRMFDKIRMVRQRTDYLGRTK